MKLSLVYQLDSLWAVAYESAKDEIELLDKVFATFAQAEEYARKQGVKNYRNHRLFIVAFNDPKIMHTVI